MKVGRLAVPHVAQLGFFEIGRDEGAAARHDREERLTGGDVLTPLHVLLRDRPVTGEQNLRVVQIQLRLVEPGLRGLRHWRPRFSPAPRVTPTCTGLTSADCFGRLRLPNAGHRLHRRRLRRGPRRPGPAVRRPAPAAPRPGPDALSLRLRHGRLGGTLACLGRGQVGLRRGRRRVRLVGLLLADRSLLDQEAVSARVPLRLFGLHADIAATLACAVFTSRSAICRAAVAACVAR